MCKLLIGIKQNNSQIDNIQQVLKAQVPTMFDQPHGIGALILTEQGKIETQRELKNYAAVAKWFLSNIEKAKLFAIHTRISTSGSIDERNIHFFKHKGRYLAHNGMIGKFTAYNHYFGQYRMFDLDDDRPQTARMLDRGGKWVDAGEAFSSVRDEEKVDALLEAEEKMATEKVGIEKSNDCDTLQFLKNLPEHYSKKRLKKYCDKSNFMGVALLVNEKYKNAALLTTREIMAHKDSTDNWLIMYSWDATLSTTKKRSLFGIEISEKNVSQNILKTKIDRGIYFLQVN